MTVYLFILGVIAAILGIVDIVWGLILKKILPARICAIILYFVVAIAFIVVSFCPPKPVEKEAVPIAVEEKVVPPAEEVAPTEEVAKPPVEVPAPPEEEAAPPEEVPTPSVEETIPPTEETG